MTPRHARYPFFEAAREAVEAADIALPELVAEDAPAVERGVERVRRALVEGTVAAEDPRRWDHRNELLSYPVARILVSLVDVPAAVDKYADAEARTAQERFVADVESDTDGLRSTDDGVDLDAFLREFDLADAVAPERRAGPGATGNRGEGGATGGRRFRVAVGAYLALSDRGWGEEWRLVNRELADGRVRVEREELYRLLREAVRRRVADGLPFEVRGSAGGDYIADELAGAVDDLRTLLADRGHIHEIAADTVAPDLFPPCMARLLERTRRGVDLDPPAAFALTAFLTGIGMDTEEILSLYRPAAVDEEQVRYQTEYLRDTRGTQYAPPSCATMDEYGLCFPDERCETIAHPLSYYETALDDADEITEWEAGDDRHEEASAGE
jgi:DNA primase large subunit